MVCNAQMHARVGMRVGLATLLAGAALGAQSGTEKRAQKLLLAAMDAARDGHYAQAVAGYRKVAKKYPSTDAALVARVRSGETAFLGFADVERNGPSSNRLDVVVMGDGYRLEDQNEFDDIAKACAKVFRRHKLFGEYYAYHNFIRANLRSKDQGVTGFGRTKQTALGGYIAGKVQGQVGVRAERVRAYLREVDNNDGQVIAIVKAGSAGTGGGGIATVGGRADDTILHEWGHAFARLSDEYTVFTGHRGEARNSVNISTSKDPLKAPSAHFVRAGVPGVGAYPGGAGRIKGV